MAKGNLNQKREICPKGNLKAKTGKSGKREFKMKVLLLVDNKRY